MCGTPSGTKAPGWASHWTRWSKPLLPLPKGWSKARSSKPLANKPRLSKGPSPVLTAVASVPKTKRTAPSRLPPVPSSTMNRSVTAWPAAGIFFPLRPLLGLDSHAYSKAALAKIIAAGGELKSFQAAARMLDRLADIPVSARHVNRLVDLVGLEMRHDRDVRVEDHVHHRRAAPPAAPEACAVLIDGGRVMTRTPRQDKGTGVFDHAWREDKVACLHVLEGPTFEFDPHPQPPRCFPDRSHVDRITREIHGLPALPETPAAAEVAPPDATNTEKISGCGVDTAMSQEKAATTQAASWSGRSEKEDEWPPSRKERTCVATMLPSAGFAKVVAQEAYARGFYQAKRKAFLGDGLAYNWTIKEGWFEDFTAITDFIHPLTYLYELALLLAGGGEEGWVLYARWLTWSWQGKVADVLGEMRQWRDKLGPVGCEEKLAESDVREVLRRTLGYIENNESRMDYPTYRRQGLPVTTAHVESLIKEINYRVKGTEKFWNNPKGAEAILQVRAALLSDDLRLDRHLQQRKGSPYRYSRVPRNGKPPRNAPAKKTK